jgi:hypothetical protein
MRPPADVERKSRRRIAESRGLGLFVVLSNLRETRPDASDIELRVLLFDRLYGDEIDPSHRASIVARLRGERQAV